MAGFAALYPPYGARRRVGWVERSETRHLLAFLLFLLLPSCAIGAELKLATWNLEWLTTNDRDLPADAHPKQPEDIDLLRRYAVELDADVIAVQEVDGPAIAARVFPPDRYSIHLSHDHVVQRVGIVVRRDIPYNVNPDVTGLDLGPGRQLRSGVDITLRTAAAVACACGASEDRLLRRSADHQQAPLLRRTARADAAAARLDRRTTRRRQSRSPSWATSTATWMAAISSGPRCARPRR